MHDKIFALPVIKQLSPYITQRQLGELPLIVISHPKVRGAVSLQGAQLIDWQPSGQKPCLWLSPESAFQEGIAIRGGIPICWPWFGPVSSPSHGFARISPWQFTAHNEHDCGVILTFTLSDSESTRKLWPHAFTLILRMKLGETCELELESHGDFEATAALHSYFNISDIQKATVYGLGGHYIDKVADREIYASEPLKFNKHVDRIYTEPEEYSLLRDDGWERTIELHHYHHSDVVCWNPWAELSCSMQDMPNNGYKQMVCVETARIHNPMKSEDQNPARLSLVMVCRENRPQD
ncbi:Putative glucose-6-phosphate 1-epimerase [Providencia rustigianii]|uniref:Putative glucose-6-phosphate 1-epimerase n=1 Tax=Providencia rustigianii DSM 4541 TaxID=500637 RepID=D1NYH0_9GAMM|nr:MULTISPECIES: D-hexose-6-phosphate mutarotase [Providencia]EFB73518.1 aldose 1-epimerase [Providencia rustigianii DSM 4541]MTC57608.1 D-hexose-6-phosphate mutarotase [Providencia rustigianii]MTC59120.1 D-hexose-6-phosphate mutarotase [Providencia rustigianii]SPY77702.1 Putative glucose-6-phosphate 1-epimerase [Providencia rustigianii]SUC27162.1 Putative glucose-6-phosphate 1-epimerase [Providencia rustigianii]